MREVSLKPVRGLLGVACLLACLAGWIGYGYADDIETRLPSTNGSDAFQVQNSIGDPLLHVQSNGRIGIGTTDPKRILHLSTNSWPVKFEFTGTDSHANLDFDSPWITPGNLSRLDWRSNIDSQSEQFAAIDVVFVDKSDQSAKADMRFSTMSNGNLKQHMVITNEGYVGIGWETPSRRLHVKDSSSNVSIINFENTYNGSYADLLNLKINTNDPGSDNAFITFYDSGTVVGAITGDGGGGITWVSHGSDVAEYMPRLKVEERIEPGDIVGLFGGKISKMTSRAEQVLAVSTAPLVLGGAPGNQKEHLYEKVAFLGQVPIRVRGPVRTGDYIIPSGRNDGTGLAVSPERLTPELASQVVGRSVQNSSEDGIKLVKGTVGLHNATQPVYAMNQKMVQEIRDLTQANQQLVARLVVLEKMVREMQTKDQ